MPENGVVVQKKRYIVEDAAGQHDKQRRGCPMMASASKMVRGRSS